MGISWFGLRSLAAVLLLVYAALVAAPTPVRAQNTCPEPDDIWCATLTVAELEVGSLTFGFGYNINIGGALSHDEFRYEGTDYTVALVNITRFVNPSLQIQFAPTGETVFGTDGLLLYVDGTPFAFDDAEFTSNQFIWGNSGLSWAVGATVEVRLTKAPEPGGSLQGQPQIVFAANSGSSEPAARCLGAPYEFRRWANRPGGIPGTTWTLDVVEPSGGFRNGASFTADDFEISDGQVKTIAEVNYPNQENTSNVQPFEMVITAVGEGVTRSRTVRVYILKSDRTDHSSLNVCGQAAGEGAKRPRLSVADAEAYEGIDSHLKFRLRLNRPAPVPISVAYWTYQGTATRGTDYNEVPKKTVTFEVDEQFKEVLVAILADDEADDGETVILELAELSENANYGRSRATGTIRDAPTGPSTLYVRNTRAEEFDEKMEFVVSLYPPSNGVVTVNYTTADGTAEAGFDYTTRSGTLTFGVGETHKTITVPITDDTLEESDPFEFFFLNLTDPSGATFERGVTSWTANGIIENHETEENSSAVSSEIADEPLTAEFTGVPDEHDGSSAFTFRIAFSEDIRNSYRRVRDDLLAATGGTVTGARRVDGRRDLWEIEVDPSGSDGVTVTLAAGDSCATAPCTSDGRTLSQAITATIEGPPLPGLSVADAQVEEGPGAKLGFAITLDRAVAWTVTVQAATSDGTAVAGEDYRAKTLTKTFAPGETRKVAVIRVLEDGHDDDGETLTLTLSNPSGAFISDGTATGTITNSDPLQKMWLARFGRTVALQTVKALEGRFAIGSDASPRMTMTVAGQSMDLSRIGDDKALAETITGLAQAFGAPGAPAANDNDPFARHGFGEAGNGAVASAPAQPVTGRDLLLGSSFHFTTGEASGLGGAMTGWGKVLSGGSSSSFGGGLSFTSETATGVLGMDWERDRLLVGVALSRSVEKGSAAFDRTGLQYDIEGSLSMVTPYMRVRAGERLSFWSAVGSGSGSM